MPIDITDVNAFTDPITAPAGSDPANAASVVDVAQKLANRTRFLKNERDRLQGYVGGETGDSAWAYENARTRSYLLELSDGNPGGSGWTYSTIAGVWNSAADNGRLAFALRVPHGASILELAAYVTPGSERATTGDRMRIGLTITELDNDLTPEPLAADIQLGNPDDGDDEHQVIVFTPGSPIVVDRYGGAKTYLGWVDSGDGGSADALWGFGVTVELPGPPEV